jgi:dTDP-4-dehydrorhamnose reductase
MTRILLLGGEGQVGWELQRALAPLGTVSVAPRHGASAVDLCVPATMRAALEACRPQVIVNAAACNAVDAAERDPAPAMAVNAEAPAVLAAEAARAGALLVHFSTDQVLAGEGDAPQGEDTPPAPLNAYGRSKLAGEQAIQASGCRHLVLRTTWVHSSRRPNFLRAMLTRAAEQDTLTVVADEVGTPTGAELVADATAHALKATLDNDGLCGLYHCVAAGATSRHAYVRFLLEAAAALGLPLRTAPEGVQPVSSAAFGAPAARPLNARLDPSRFERAFGLHMPPWQDGVRRTLREIATR